MLNARRAVSTTLLAVGGGDLLRRLRIGPFTPARFCTRPGAVTSGRHFERRAQGHKGTMVRSPVMASIVHRTPRGHREFSLFMVFLNPTTPCQGNQQCGAGPREKGLAFLVFIVY